jgi:hypothetical protein
MTRRHSDGGYRKPYTPKRLQSAAQRKTRSAEVCRTNGNWSKHDHKSGSRNLTPAFQALLRQ